jgi:hypothetical protein
VVRSIDRFGARKCFISQREGVFRGMDVCRTRDLDDWMPAVRRRLAAAAIVLALTATLLGLGVGSASANTGTFGVTCNPGFGWAYILTGPTVSFNTVNLLPATGTEQHLATKEFIYSNSTGQYTYGPWHEYLANRDPYVTNVPTADSVFNLGSGWYAAGVILLAWNGRSWESSGKFIMRYGAGSNLVSSNGYWCKGK